MKEYKRNDPVYVCYDGKWGRRAPGTVTDVRAQQIRVKFEEWASEEKNELESWFYLRKRNGYRYYAGWVKVEKSLMNMLFGAKGDWYSVVDKKTIDDYFSQEVT